MISIVIPCIPKHFWNINNILEAYKVGTKQPDEIVVALSECDSVPASELDALVKKGVKLFPMKEVGSSAMNRQNGSDLSTGDLIIYQDADDLPHPRRVEIIDWFFGISDIVHLNHSYFRDHSYPKIGMIKILRSDVIYNTYFPNKVFEESRTITPSYGPNLGFTENGVEIPVHTGAVAIRREVLKQVRWKEVKDMLLVKHYRYEDYEFCLETVFKFNKSIIIDAKLYQYN